MKTSQNREIRKLHVEAAVLFAINNIPGIDETTLEKFLELVNVTGNFGTISEEQLLDKMSLIMKHIPGACQRSLFTVAELLEVQWPNRLLSRPERALPVNVPFHDQAYALQATAW